MSDTLAALTTTLSPEFLISGDITTNQHHRPCDFTSSSSTESESDDDENMNITGLTHRFTRSLSLQDRLLIAHRLEKTRVFSGSPEMRFGRNVSGGTRVRSSPATPFAPAEEDYQDLVYAAAGEIARMKMMMKMNTVNDALLAIGSLIGAPRHPGAPLSHHNHHHHHLPNCENEEFLRHQQFRRRFAGGFNSGCGGRCGTKTPVPVLFPPSAWPPLPVETQCRQQPPQPPPLVSLVSGGCGRRIATVKKERSGTGVFLPRSYCNLPPESKKTPDTDDVFCPHLISFNHNVYHHHDHLHNHLLEFHTAAGIPQSFNKNMNPIINQPPPPQQQQSNINGRYVQQYHLPPPSQNNFKRDELAELLMARRTAVTVAPQRRSTANVGSPEVVLPQEWTY